MHVCVCLHACLRVCASSYLRAACICIHVLTYRVGLIRAQCLQRVIHVRVAGLVRTHGQDEVTHGSIGGQAPVLRVCN